MALFVLVGLAVLILVLLAVLFAREAARPLAPAETLTESVGESSELVQERQLVTERFERCLERTALRLADDYVASGDATVAAAERELAGALRLAALECFYEFNLDGRLEPPAQLPVSVVIQPQTLLLTAGPLTGVYEERTYAVPELSLTVANGLGADLERLERLPGLFDEDCLVDPYAYIDDGWYVEARRNGTAYRVTVTDYGDPLEPRILRTTTACTPGEASATG